MFSKSKNIKNTNTIKKIKSNIIRNISEFIRKEITQNN